MAYDTKTKIIPFAIKGKYQIFSKNLVITFGEAIDVYSENLTEENDKLRKIIMELLGDEDE